MEASHTGDASNPIGQVLSIFTAVFYCMSISDIDKFFITPAMHVVTLTLGAASLYFLLKPKNQNNENSAK